MSGVSIATLALDVDARPVDAATRSLASLDAQAVRTGASTERLASLTQAYGGESTKAASAAEQMGASIRAQEAALRSAVISAQSAATVQVKFASAVEATTAAVKAAAGPLAATAKEIDFYRNRMIAATVAQTGFTEAQARAALGMAAAETEAIALGAAHADVGKKIGLTSMQIRELLVLAREGARGDMTRFAGSFSLLAGTVTAANIGLFGMVGGVVAVAAGVAVMVYGIIKGQIEIEKINGSLIKTGNYAGETANNMDVLAKSISASSDTTIGSSRKTVEALVATGTFGKSSIESVSDAVQNYSRITGESSEKIVKEYDGQKGGLIRWAVKHEEAYHDITVTQLDHIALLIREGQEARAQDELNADIDAESKKRMAEKKVELEVHYGWLITALHKTGLAASWMWDRIEGIGRKKTQDEEVAGLYQRLDGLNSRYNTHEGNTPAVQAARSAAQAEVSKLQLQAQTDSANAMLKAADAADRHSVIAVKYGPNHAPKPAKPKAEVVDDYAMRNDTADAALAQANAAELHAELELTTGIQARATLEKQIFNEQTNAADARTQRMIDQALNDGKMNDAERANVVHKLKQVQDEASITLLLHIRLTDQQTFNALAQQTLATKTNEINVQLATLEGQKALSKSTYAGALIEKKILDLKYEEQKLKLENLRDQKGAAQTQIDQAIADLKILDITHTTEDLLNQRNTTLLAAIKEATGGTAAFFAAIKSRDWQGIFDSFAKTLQTVQASFTNNGTWGGLATLGSVAGQAIGGKAGSAIGTGLGIGALGFSIGTSAAGLGAALSLGGSLATVGTLGAGGMLTAIAPLLGPIGLAVGAIVALTSLFVKSKPTNAGATYDLATGAISGSKADASTTSASKGAGSSILQMENALITAGVKLTTTVNSIEIGARDLSKINLSTGAQLTAAVGDAADTANVAMRAILEGATFATEAEQSLVKSMLAAGKSFDDISAAIQGYTAAQGLLNSVTDAILQITDPKAYDLSTTKAAQDARDKQVKDALDAGYLTADQFDAITAQLTKLKGLEIDKVMAKYAIASTEAADSAARLAEAVTTANAGVATAQGNLRSSYQAESSALQSTISASKALAKTLLDFKSSIGDGPDGSTTYEQAKAAYLAAQQGDGANLPAAAQAFLTASLAHATDATQYARDVADVKNAVERAANTATATASNAELQLDALTKQVSALITINTSVLSVVDAIKALDGALALQTSAIAAAAAAKSGATTTPTGGVFVNFPQLTGVYPTPANDNASVSIPQTGSGGAGPSTVQDMPAQQVAALGGGGGSRWWDGSNVQAFARGGVFSNGVVSQPTAFDPAVMGEAGPEAVMPLVRGPRGLAVRSTGDSGNVAILAELRAIREENRAAAIALAKNSAETAKLQRKWDGEGLPAVRS